MGQRIYFDNSATTPLDPRVRESMKPYFGEVFGNPSSLHWAGRRAHEALGIARRQVADLFGADADEITFTASGTEADNMALLGVVEAFNWRDCHIITSAIEHPAILETCRYLAGRGVEVTYLPVDSEGIVDPDNLLRVLRPTTRLVSVMAANNVVGSIQPIAELGRIAHEHGALFHTDAVQAAGKIPLNTQQFPVDLISMSAHKLHGPKGTGALYIRDGVRIKPLVHGGGQEKGLRSATENVAGIVGFGRAAEIARSEMSEEASRLVNLRDRIIDGISEAVPNAYLIGHRFCRLPGHVSLGLANQEGEAVKLLLALDEQGIAVSTGSACSANHGSEPSYILVAMGFDQIRARGSLRITLGRFNTDAEVDRFLEVFPAAVGSLRTIASHAF
jgi:cysteine desulfurase